MGTLVTQRLSGRHAGALTAGVAGELRRLEGRFSVYRPASEISRLNAAAGQGDLKASPECVHLLEQAVAWSARTAGAFDVTIGPLVELWQLSAPTGRPPSRTSIARSMDLVDYRDLQLDNRTRTARLRRPGQRLDLGGIAKGHAGDRAAALYRANQIRSALINPGGNVVAVGGQPGGRSWRVGVQHPRGRAGQCLGVIQVRDGSVVTAGDYERFYRRGRTRYHHIIDPRTGYPARSGLISVTVVTGPAVAADALSTAVLVLGLEAGLELVRSTAGAEAVLIAGGLAVYVTRGLSGRYQRAPGAAAEQYV